MTILSINKSNLYIFTTSDTPDLYINVIGYCISHYNIDHIYFLDIFKDIGQKPRVDKRLRDIRDRVTLQLTNLKNDEYLYWDRKQEIWLTRAYKVDDIGKDRYLEISHRDIETHSILYESLNAELQKFIDTGSPIFDVSGALKAFLVDIYVILGTKKYTNIYTFELRRPRRTHDEEELIHNLSLDNGDYVYDNLTDSTYTRDTIVAMSEQHILSSNRDKIIHIAASDFAQFILKLYGILIFLSIIGTIALIQQFGWDKIEPWSFVLISFIPYLVGIIAQMIWKRRFDLSPDGITDLVRDYKAKQLLLESRKNTIEGV